MPFVHHRSVYVHSKRLRVVTPGKLYRSGESTAAGFRDAVRQFQLRTIINLQETITRN